MDPNGLRDAARSDFHRQLIEAGLLVSSGVDGVYGRSGKFESVINAIDRTADAAGAHLKLDSYTFPPIVPARLLQQTGYIYHFPNLAGSIHSFHGTPAEHAQLLATEASGQDWNDFLSPAAVAMASAACHVLYPMLSGELPEGGRCIDVRSFCFRNEPAIDPARMQAFRMREFVRIGAAADVAAYREEWVGRGLEILESLGLEAEPMPANDPFFGRPGRLLAKNQLSENLKTELVVRLYGDLDDGTAVMSCNYHQDHFGHTFGIVTDSGDIAHSACTAFGMERIALAMFRTHGLDIASWDAGLKDRLGL